MAIHEIMFKGMKVKVNIINPPEFDAQGGYYPCEFEVVEAERDDGTALDEDELIELSESEEFYEKVCETAEYCDQFDDDYASPYSGYDDLEDEDDIDDDDSGSEYDN